MILLKQSWFAGLVVWMTLVASTAALSIVAEGGSLHVIGIMNAVLIFTGYYLVAYSMVVRVRENLAKERHDEST